MYTKLMYEHMIEEWITIVIYSWILVRHGNEDEWNWRCKKNDMGEMNKNFARKINKFHWGCLVGHCIKLYVQQNGKKKEMHVFVVYAQEYVFLANISIQFTLEHVFRLLAHRYQIITDIFLLLSLEIYIDKWKF